MKKYFVTLSLNKLSEKSLIDDSKWKGEFSVFKQLKKNFKP